jgi:hypothetical protein
MVAAEYTECTSDTSNVRRDNPSVSAEHTEFTSYTRIVIADSVNVSAEHTEFMGYTRIAIDAHSICTHDNSKSIFCLTLVFGWSCHRSFDLIQVQPKLKPIVNLLHFRFC